MQDLIGCEVLMQKDGSTLGTVTNVYDAVGELDITETMSHCVLTGVVRLDITSTEHASNFSWQMMHSMLSSCHHTHMKPIILFAGPGAHDLLCISISQNQPSAHLERESPAPKKMLLPFAKDFVPEVIHDQNRIQISPPAGLLELSLSYGSKSKKETQSNRRQIGRNSREANRSKGGQFDINSTEATQSKDRQFDKTSTKASSSQGKQREKTSTEETRNKGKQTDKSFTEPIQSKRKQYDKNYTKSKQ